MSEANAFDDFLRRIRAGDEQAAAELVRQYEPLIRREIHFQLEDQRLRRVFDSMDVCQSVLASFFLRTAAGEYELEDPRQLLKLLVTMARNKLASAARRQHRQRRDNRRLSPDGAEGLENVARDEATPSQQVAGRELLDRFRALLSPEECQLVDLRSDGLSWDEVAERLGGTAQSRRMQLARAVERVVRELKLDESQA
jgi:RNA polymerase sigma factor (sigma-70 family)